VVSAGAVELSGVGGVGVVLSGAGVVELSGAGVGSGVGAGSAGTGSAGAGVMGAGAVVDGSELGLEVSSLLSQAVSATANTEARIKVLLIMLRLL